MAGLGNPLATIDGAIGDLGLSSAAKEQANDIANKAKKKKMQDQMDMKAAGAAGSSSAFQALTGYGTP